MINEDAYLKKIKEAPFWWGFYKMYANADVDADPEKSAAANRINVGLRKDGVSLWDLQVEGPHWQHLVNQVVAAHKQSCKRFIPNPQKLPIGMVKARIIEMVLEHGFLYRKYTDPVRRAKQKAQNPPSPFFPNKDVT